MNKVEDSQDLLLSAMAGWSSQKTKGERRSSSLAIFLSLRDDVRLAMAAGYSRKTIWEFLEDTRSVPFSYATFIRYVAEHITGQDGGLGDGTQKAKRAKNATTKEPK